MSKGTDIRGKWALVTGASSGLGVDFATELAARGANLILVARRNDRLLEVAETLRRAHSITVEIIAMDLETAGAADALFQRVSEAGWPVEILVNNAGFGLYGDFLDVPWKRTHAMLELNIVALVHLTNIFARDMVARKFGRIMQVASIGAYAPTPSYAAYSASKAFVRSFGEALHFELRGTGVTCTVVSPGVTATEFLQVSGQKPTLYQRLSMMRSDRVARLGVRAMLAGRPSIVTGFNNMFSTVLMRVLPSRVATFMAWLTMKQPAQATTTAATPPSATAAPATAPTSAESAKTAAATAPPHPGHPGAES